MLGGNLTSSLTQGDHIQAWLQTKQLLYIFTKFVVSVVLVTKRLPHSICHNSPKVSLVTKQLHFCHRLVMPQLQLVPNLSCGNVRLLTKHAL